MYDCMNIDWGIDPNEPKSSTCIFFSRTGVCPCSVPSAPQHQEPLPGAPRGQHPLPWASKVQAVLRQNAFGNRKWHHSCTIHECFPPTPAILCCRSLTLLVMLWVFCGRVGCPCTIHTSHNNLMFILQRNKLQVTQVTTASAFTP